MSRPARFRDKRTQRRRKGLGIQSSVLRMGFADLRGALRALQETQSELEASRQRYADLYELAPVGYCTLDKNGCMQDINLTGAQWLGCERSRLLNRPLLPLISRADRRKFLRHLHRLRTGHAAASVTLRLEDRNGAGRPVELVSRLIYGDRNLPAPIRTVLVDLSERERVEVELRKARDELELRVRERTAQLSEAIAALDAEIAEHKKMEAALQASEAKFRGFVESAPDASVMIERDGTLMLVNAQTERLFGYRRDELLGQRVEVLIPERYRRRHTGHRGTFFTAPAPRPMGAGLELFARRKDGTEFPVEISLSPLGIQGRVVVCAAIRDITERKHAEAERQRLQAELLRISEREQRRIAQDLHDGLGQHLAGIACLCNTLKRDLSKAASPVAATAARISQLLDSAVGQTRNLARGLHPVAPEGGGLMAALEGMAARVTELSHVSCRFVCPEPVVFEDSGAATHLYRIAQESVTNAIKHGHARRIVIRLSSTPERIVLKVRDDGKGFKLSPRQARSGLGLRIMTYRAGMIGGTMTVRRRSHGGTEAVCTVKRK